MSSNVFIFDYLIEVLIC